MVINDEEDLLRAIYDHVKENLNTQIQIINTKKSDSIVLEEIPSDEKHYLFSGDVPDIPNFAFVNFDIDGEIEVKSNYDDKVSLPIVLIQIAFGNPGAPGTRFKGLRYMNALANTLLNFKAVELDQMEMKKMVPALMDFESRRIVVCGVSLSAAI